MKNQTGTPIVCFKCGYSWLTRSQMFFIQCPRCRTNIRVRQPTEEERMEDLLRFLKEQGGIP